MGYVWITSQACSEIPYWLIESMSKTKSGTATKIVGGSKAKDPIPWQVHVTIVFRDGKNDTCGGTILDEETILSAAHCYGSEVRIVHVEAGLKEFPSILPRSSNVIWIKHPRYIGEPIFDHDIAILKMKKPLNLDGRNVETACLPGPSTSPEDKEMAVVSGWGATYVGGPPSGDLKSVAVPVLSRSKCKSMNNKAFNYLTTNQFCAGFQDGGEDSCQGDSGGPLVVKGLFDKAIVFGVVSHGEGCAYENLPGVYIRVDKYISWIKRYMKKVIRTQGICPKNEINYKQIDSQCLYFHEEDGYYDYERSKEICASKRGRLVEARSIRNIQEVQQQAFNTRKDTRCFFWGSGSINNLRSNRKFGYLKDCKAIYSCAKGEDDVSFECASDGLLWATGPVCQV